MEYVNIGNSGSTLFASRLAFGCEQLGGTDWGHVDPEAAANAVACALDLGVNLFDTADVYGLGRSEQLLSEALGPKRHDVIIVTKFGVNWEHNPGGGRARTYFDCSPRHVMEAAEASLLRLRVDRIPLYLVHWPDPKIQIEDTMSALLRLQEQGKVHYLGLSNFDAAQVGRAAKCVTLHAIETQYSLIDRRPEQSLFRCAADLGLGALVYGALAQGLLTGKYGPDAVFRDDDRRHRLSHFVPERRGRHAPLLKALDSVARARNKTAAQVALRWVLDHPRVSSVIVGAKSPDQVQSNAGALSWSLTTDERHTLECSLEGDPSHA